MSKQRTAAARSTFRLAMRESKQAGAPVEARAWAEVALRAAKEIEGGYVERRAAIAVHNSNTEVDDAKSD